MILIDTCGWIEWLTDGQLSREYQPCFSRIESIIVPTCVQFELYKWVVRKRNLAAALETVALTEQAAVVSLSTAIALSAADFSAEYSLSFADSVIYATARFHRAQLITSDSHFQELPDVTFFRKQGESG
ncbi:type II toxin-antitoxin system VapC family toxin [Desulfobulbus sp. US1]|nr:type II toxin-antitoxin system VapC family toxin [Desulfobulbus sp. US4]MCW5205087.1 type II toxin-antitoxin system VapC family toxin [Desulfobulbus sp. N2]MCW5208045.1 type II toxin-antitoxin system VapC family toxin [Desulfobulbus sp. US2]MCW5209721.1 type II toxin-antitoxin system VapC family toxin [Desulfobulbus sp. US1]MCW5213922.1 type II toxin-antitoxin system VapC family toxin [Desulfobulbus sp. US5]